jgi:LysR family positive regulator for ilvC
MTFREIEQFIALAHTLHFGRASQRCHISASALSRAIQRVEAEVGAELFERDNRQVKLSAAGEQLLPRAIELLANWDSAREAVQDDHAELTGTLSLYASVTACYTVLPELVAQFRTHFPRVTLSLRTGDAESALEHLHRGDADIVVAVRPEQMPPNLVFVPLTETPLVFVAPADKTAIHPTTTGTAGWLNHPFILPASGPARDRLDAWFATKGTSPNSYATISGNEAILAMVSLGCGIAAIPELVLENSPLRQTVQRLDLRPRLAPYQVGLCLRTQTAHHRAPAAFCELVRKQQTAHRETTHAE